MTRGKITQGREEVHTQRRRRVAAGATPREISAYVPVDRS